MVLGMVDGREGNTVQFFGVNSVAEDAETGIDVLVSDDAFFSGDDVDDFVTHSLPVFKEGFGSNTTDDGVFCGTAAH